jgi:hypothetical protein
VSSNNVFVTSLGAGGKHTFNATSATFTNGDFVCQDPAAINKVIDSGTICSTGSVGIYVGATGTQTAPSVLMMPGQASTGSGFVTTGLTAGKLYGISGSALTLSEASSASTVMPAVCIATTTTFCMISGTYTTSGLTANSVYYTSDGTAGTITATAPTTSGHFVQRIGMALSTTVLFVNVGLDVGTVQ